MKRLFILKKVKSVSILLLISVFILMGLAAGCSSPEATPQETIKETPEGETPEVETPEVETRELIFATHTPGGTYYTVAVAQSSIIEKHTGMMVTPQPVATTMGLLSYISNKEADISLSSAFDLDKGSKGLMMFEGQDHSDIRVLQGGHELTYAFLTTKKSGIKNWSDLKGKRIANRVGAGAHQVAIPLLLEYYGIDYNKDITLVPTEDVTTELGEGRVDAIINPIFPATIEEISTDTELVFIPTDPEAVKYVCERDLSFNLTKTAVEVGPITKGQTALGVKNYLICHKDFPDELAYLLVKTLLENHDELLALQPEVMADWSLDKALEKSPVPYHPGAVKYYKEIGIWDEEMEKHQSMLLNN